jgi:hypothetical protein
MGLWRPLLKPFINTTFWEVFWRPRAGTSALFTKKLEIPHENQELIRKYCFV